MKRVRVEAFCDLCSLEGTEVVATQLRSLGITPGEERPRIVTVDLCDSCASTLSEVLDPLLALGVPLAVKAPTAPPKAPHPSMRADADCPLCGKRMRALSVVTHLWAVHGRGMVRPEVPASCPDCGQAMDTPQSYGVHARIAHGRDAVAEALLAIRAGANGRAPRKAAAR